MKIASIVGARPEFVQAAVVSRVIRERHHEVLVHTGQHYDDLMSDVFFRELSLPEPDLNLAVGSSSPSAQLAALVEKIADALLAIEPDVVIVRGDTNSTLAGALAARQNGFPVAHIEAGMRSFDARMPEEANRIVADHLADWLFVTDEDAAANLRREGIRGQIHVVGDVMYDTFIRVVGEILPRYVPKLQLPERYDLLTLHRLDNTGDRERLGRLIGAFEDAPHAVVFPAHPRTLARIRDWAISLPSQVMLCEPLSYLEMLVAERNARMIFTDSGGVQREAYYQARPCVTLRDSTEWVNTVASGWNRLVGSDAIAIRALLTAPPEMPEAHPPLFGVGDASHRILAALETPESRAVFRYWEQHRGVLRA